MNEKFFSLPQKKQNAILKAGYRVFARNSYKKSPMREIAEEAGISKALLFHYFHNKRELYLFLWEKCAETTEQYLKKYHCYDPEDTADLFECMRRGLRAKVQLMRRWPDIGAFAVRAYYEKDPEVREDIRKSVEKHAAFGTIAQRTRLNPAYFVPELDLKRMYQEMYWASEGYLWDHLQSGALDAERIEQDFGGMIEFWKKLYLRKDE